MPDRIITTPFYIGEPMPGIATVGPRDSQVVEPVLAGLEDPQSRMSIMFAELAAHTAAALAAGRRPVSICGDCCSSLGVMAGLQRAGIDPVLVWVDAHGDFNTWETSPSGFLGGMPLAMMVGRGEQRMPGAVGLRPVAEHDVILSDARDLDPLEAEALAGSNVQQLADINQVCGRLPPERPVYLHFDSDVITAAEAPAQNYPVPGGPTAAEVAAAFAAIAATDRVVAASISTWNPALDEDGKTASRCMAAFQKLLG